MKNYFYIILILFFVVLVGLFVYEQRAIFSSKDREIEILGQNRKYLIHKPISLVGKAPLVIALHGFGDHPRLMEFYSGWSKKADEERFIVVYPYGSVSKNIPKLSWNAGSCCGGAFKNNVNDIAFIQSLVNELISQGDIDENRIYLTGFSNGALMTQRLAAEIPDKFTAVGTVAGSIGGRISYHDDYYKIPNPKFPISVILIHGKKDTDMPFDGGDSTAGDPGTEFTSAQETLEFWVRRNASQTTPIAEKLFKDNVVRESYVKGVNGTKVVYYKVVDGGHTWFGGIFEPFRSIFGDGFSATDVLWEEFYKISKT